MRRQDAVRAEASLHPRRVCQRVQAVRVDDQRAGGVLSQVEPEESAVHSITPVDAKVAHVSLSHLITRSWTADFSRLFLIPGMVREANLRAQLGARVRT